MSHLRTPLLMLATAAVCFLIASATGLAGGNGRNHYVRPGDYVSYVGLDWNCIYFETTTGGRFAECGRQSTSRAISTWTTGRWVRVFRGGIQGPPRSFIYSHRRNP